MRDKAYAPSIMSFVCKIMEQKRRHSISKNKVYGFFKRAEPAIPQRIMPHRLFAFIPRGETRMRGIIRAYPVWPWLFLPTTTVFLGIVAAQMILTLLPAEGPFGPRIHFR